MSDFEHARRKDLTGHPVFGVPAPDTSELLSRFPVLGCDVERGIPSTPLPTQPVAPTGDTALPAVSSFHG